MDLLRLQECTVYKRHVLIFILKQETKNRASSNIGDENNLRFGLGGRMGIKTLKMLGEVSVLEGALNKSL